MSGKWVRAGACAGVYFALGYLAFAVVPMPARLRYLLFFSIPLGGILFVAGLYAMLKERGETVLLQIAALFGVIGCSIANAMAVVQIAIHLRMSARAPNPSDPTSREWIRWVQDSVNAVHLGLDVSLDIFVLSSFTLFGIAMARDPRFPRLFGPMGSAVALSTLLLNLYAFPIPPDPDLGPLVGVWALAVAVRMLWQGSAGTRKTAAAI